jgi:tripartite ATP-independent transporter DctM subunit
VAVLAVMTLLPLVEIGGRTFAGRGVAGSIVLVQHLTLWVALLGAALAARSDRLLALSTPVFLSDRWRVPVRIGTSAVAAGISGCLTYASLVMVRTEGGAGDTVAWGIPVSWALVVLPAGFGVVTARLVSHASDGWGGRTLAALGLAFPVLFAWQPGLQDSGGVILSAGLLIAAATILGMPIFAAIGGTALLMFWADATPVTAVPGETYRLTVSPMLPAIPLFCLSGYLLAEGGASTRLARLLTALVGWLPGGLAIVTTVVLAFFTPLTGASGITILSMGGLLCPVLLRARYPDPTAHGLVTVSGSIGLLFFPSLPVFLYAFYANLPYDRLFIGGLLPGVLLVLVVAGYAAARGWLAGATRTPFAAREALVAVWQAKWELALPLVVLGSLISGLATLVESAAIAVLYALVAGCVVHRELTPRDVSRVAVECATLVGGFLIILSVALGFTAFLVLAEIPTQALAWVRSHIASPEVFLLALNLLLIVVGALMDIYSAIVVFVPLITPIAAEYGIDPVHLGIVFLANMELGYLMPPMGENLFLSSYRFRRPLSEVYRSILPYTVMLVIAVLLITYLPSLTQWLVGLYDARGG